MTTPLRRAARAWIRIFRDFVLIIVGAYIVLHETEQRGEPRIELLMVALVMLGLPPVLRAYFPERPDERKRNRNSEAD